METAPRRRGAGFAAMEPERRRELQAKGGRAAQRNGFAHHFNPQEAREAARKRVKR